MVLIAFLAQNMMSGFVFGTFGTFVTTFERDLHLSRSMSTLPVPLVLVALALTAPLLGALAPRSSIRTLMILGALLSGAGYATLPFAHGIQALLVSYGVLLGPGSALLGAMLPSALVANWFEEGRGRALGLVNMSVLVGVMPLVSTSIMAHYSIRMVFAVLSAAMLLLVPVLMLVVDHPAKLGLRAVGAAPQAALNDKPRIWTYSDIMRQPPFWAFAFMGWVIAGASIAMVSHLVPMTEGWGLSPARAAMLSSAMGIMTVVGSPLFGWLADRLGGPAALALNAGMQALIWSGMMVVPRFGTLVPLCLTLGIMSGGLVAVLNTGLSRRFHAANFGRAYGLFALSNLPFTVFVPILFGTAFVATGSYAIAFIGQIAALALAAIVGVVLHLHDLRAAALALNAENA